MLNREAISQALSELREHVRSRNAGQVRSHAALLMEQLDLLTRPIRDRTKTETRSIRPPVIAAERQGLSVANIRYVRSLVSEALVLSGSDQWEAAKNAAQRALDRWNEETGR